MSVTFKTSNKLAEAVNTKYRRADSVANIAKELLSAHDHDELEICKHTGLLVSHEDIERQVIQHTGGDDAGVLCASYANGFVGGLVLAYNEHHKIVLRPENFWIAVLTQFSLYVNKHAEHLRGTFVDFEGQKQLTVYAAGTLHTVDHGALATAMTDQIAKNLKDPSIREWILPSFTTTTRDDTAVCSVVMMAALQKFFSYKMMLCCGIPEVTLLGTPEDYENLRDRVDKLLEFDNSDGLMKKWHRHLVPVFDELVRASKGKHDPDFWARVCHWEGGGSGPSYLSGWVTAFCCFDERGAWQGELDDHDFPTVESNDIPIGYCTVPVVIDDNGTKYDTTMLAGSFALELVEKTTLAPRLDWCICMDTSTKVVPSVDITMENKEAQHQSRCVLM